MLAAGYFFGQHSDSSPDREIGYAEDYARHEPLRIQGYPSTGSLRLVQEAVWKIGDGNRKGLEALASSDATESDRTKTVSNWIDSFRKGAQGRVTADFYGSAVDRQAVVLYFHDTEQVKSINIRLDGNGGMDGWRLKMLEPDPEQATTNPDWVPKAPRERDQVRLN
ncbi:hypothetical protein [Streptomyces virginiae]|uniref:hypothetical protein n=1 Tax=Streptomyces virginiae TaxID=1961 RepID=UPI002250FB95|nr:hypothetical protein [Streptomyces virginiae]MCX4960074.1 hypothetical protein [Streptomyces virginiae]